LLRSRFTILVISLFTALSVTGCSNPYQKIHMDSPAFIYGDKINQETRLTLDGHYDKRNYSFMGTLSLGDNIKLEHVIITHGFSLISYEGAKRTSVGQVFFDHKSLSLSFEVTDPVIYKLITSESYDGVSELVVSSPASTIEEAKRVTEELRQMKAPYEK
jgi:hypothetical protein